MGEWRDRDRDLRAMREWVAERDSDSMTALIVVRVMRGAPLPEMTDALTRIVMEADDDTRQWWAVHGLT